MIKRNYEEWLEKQPNKTYELIMNVNDAKELIEECSMLGVEIPDEEATKLFENYIRRQ